LVNGVQRVLAPAGHLQRLTFVDQGRTVLVMGFHADGSLRELRCDGQTRVPQDVAPCGHAGALSEITLVDAAGRPTGVMRHLAGHMRFQSVLDELGRTLRTEEVKDGRRTKRLYFPSGQVCSEADFLDRHPGEAPGREGVAREWAESGQLTQETLWFLGRERVVRQWYLNGQLKMQQTIDWQGRHQRRATESFWESGLPAAVNQERNGHLLGWQKYFDEAGVLRREDEHGERHPRDHQRRADHLRQTLPRDLSVLGLAARLLHLDDQRAILGPAPPRQPFQPPLDRVGQMRRARGLEPQFHRRRHLVHILPAGAR
jgi:hypothetical protein